MFVLNVKQVKWIINAYVMISIYLEQNSVVLSMQNSYSIQNDFQARVPLFM